MDPGIAGAATTFVVVVVFGLIGWFLARRQRRLERLEQRKVWRRDWLVGEALVDRDEPVPTR